jgi:NADH-quinone oxidoreductase subunit C
MKTPEDIIHLLNDHKPGILVDSSTSGMHPHVRIKPEDLTRVCCFLRDEPALHFDLLRCITAVDRPEQNAVELVYELMSIPFTHSFAVKTMLDRTAPEIETVSSIWPAADWHEREAFDLMGVRFVHHPDLRRILMPDDWTGHPLRKDYEDPFEYHGLKINP